MMGENSPNSSEIRIPSVFLWHTFLQVVPGGPWRVLFSVWIAVLHYFRVFLTMAILRRFWGGESVIRSRLGLCWWLRRSVCNCWRRDILQSKFWTIGFSEEIGVGSCRPQRSAKGPKLNKDSWDLLDSWTRATKPIRGSWGVNCRSDGGGGEAANTVGSKLGFEENFKLPVETVEKIWSVQIQFLSIQSKKKTKNTPMKS